MRVNLLSRFNQVLCWLPLALLVTITLYLWLGVLKGGLDAIGAWYLIQLLVPLIGTLLLISSIAWILVKRRIGIAVSTHIIASVSALLPLTWAFGIWPVAYPVSLNAASPAATVRVPTDSPMRVAWGGNKIDGNYHAAFPDQRWAYDLVIAPYLTGSGNLEDYGCYGATVVAPSSGHIIVAHDSEPDEIPGQESKNVETPAGNHIVIRLNNLGTYIVIAHLKRDSIVVSRGQAVVESEAVGQCGNSGNTSEPHVHVHHQRQNPAEYPLNFAEGLPLFFRDHAGPAMPQGGLRERNGTVVAVGDVIHHSGNREPDGIN